MAKSKRRTVVDESTTGETEAQTVTSDEPVATRVRATLREEQEEESNDEEIKPADTEELPAPNEAGVAVAKLATLLQSQLRSIKAMYNPYVAALACLCLVVGGCYGKKNPDPIDPEVRAVGTTANSKVTTLNLRTDTGDYKFQLPADQFRGNILTIEEYEMVQRNEEVVATKARAAALSSMTDLLRAQTESANNAAAAAAAKARPDITRKVLENREPVTTITPNGGSGPVDAGADVIKWEGADSGYRGQTVIHRDGRIEHR